MSKFESRTWISGRLVKKMNRKRYKSFLEKPNTQNSTFYGPKKAAVFIRGLSKRGSRGAARAAKSL